MPTRQYLWPIALGVVVLLIAEQRLRRHICWAVTHGSDMGQLREYYKADAANGYLPLPSQYEGFRQWAKLDTPALSRPSHLPHSQDAPPPAETAPTVETPATLALPEPELEDPLPELSLEPSPSVDKGRAKAAKEQENSSATRADLPAFPV